MALFENELHTRLAARVIDRLRLGPFHARKIRCNKQEYLPKAPTTERLPDFWAVGHVWAHRPPPLRTHSSSAARSNSSRLPSCSCGMRRSATRL